MNKQPYDSLRSKLVLPFVLLGFSVSAILSLVTFGLVAQLEEAAIMRILQVEMENFQSRKAQNPLTPPPSTSVLSGHYLPVKDFPLVHPVKPGHQLVERFLQNTTEYSVLITHIDDRPYALFYDRSYLTSRLGELALFLLIGTTLMSLLSLLVGNHLAAKVLRPINRLLGEISQKTSDTKQLLNTPLSFSAKDYPADEIGRLVQALDQFSLRLHGFLQRESHFSSDVSHELRTPVAVIRGAAEVLIEYPNLPEAIAQRLRTIYRHATRMGQILEAMLLLAREEPELTDPACSLAEIVDEAVLDALPALAGRPIEIVQEIAERPILPVERALAYVLVSNLLRNACAYTQKGVITVRLDAHHLEIQDTGIGITEDRFPALFSRHVKGEDSTGCGLGLSIVSRIAQELAWTIKIHSRSGEGTLICIQFGNQAIAEPSSGL
ncbi:MAG: HAMP domain-containing sensor histidine kinase [Rhodocyclaceae bacterium]|nr:HAMP domain-containing sensor histidine kinase [Rhodocyclaceae bacterium]